MPQSLEAQLRSTALAFTGLTSLLGGSQSKYFRWYDTTLAQASVFPAVVVTVISGPLDYTFEHRLATGWQRLQFDIWDIDPERSYQVQQQLETFLDQFNGYGTPNLQLYANQIINERKVIWPQTQPPQYQRIIDARMFFNSTT